MKNLIMTGLFAIGSVFAFAGNGEKEITELNFQQTENLIQENTINDSEVLKQYTIAIRFNVSGSGTTGTSYYKTAIEQTPCLDEAGVEEVKSQMLGVYQFMYPNSDLSAEAWYLNDCL